MNDFLVFRKMITPMVIQILFWIGVGICVIWGLITLVNGATSSYGGGGQVLLGLVVLLIGPLLVRIYCELLILLFRMNETLTDISNSVRQKPHISSPSQ